MDTLVFVVSAIYHKEDGYKTRVDMEIDKLKGDYNIILLLPHFKGETSNIPLDITPVYYKTYYDIPLHILLNKSSFKKALRDVIKRYPKCVVYGEALMSSSKAYEVCRKTKNKIVFDCHGTEPNEYELNHNDAKGMLISSYLHKKEKDIVRKCDLIVTVTNKQFELFGVNKKHDILPMLPGKAFLKDDIKTRSINRRTIRQELGVPLDKEVFVYSGQNQKWQMCEETIQIYKKISTKRKNTQLVIFSNYTDYFGQLCMKYGITNAVVRSINYMDMPKYLDACDYGFCIRDNNIINKVASPTKVLEYLSRDVVPILSEYVGDFSTDLVKRGLAILWDNNASFNKDNLFPGSQYVKKITYEMDRKYKMSIDSLFD